MTPDLSYYWEGAREWASIINGMNKTRKRSCKGMITTTSLSFSFVCFFSILLYAKMIYYYSRVLFFCAEVRILKEDTRVSAPNLFLELDFRRKDNHN